MRARDGSESALADIFQEVDEEVRREQLKKLWQRYSHYLIAACILVLAGVGGWRGYNWWENKKAAEAGAAFEAAVTLSEQGKHQEAEAAFAKIASEAGAGYRVLAKLREAADLGQTDPKAAAKAYEEIAADRSVGQVWQDLAAVRAALIQVDSMPYAELQQKLEPLTAPDRTFRHSARELLALSAWKAGDMAAARHWSEMIVSDPQTPNGIRSRVEVLTALLGPEGKA
jgi:hypothetical protein